jgi:hypothetical protein
MLLPHQVLDKACLSGLALDTLGGLYLAYDLLGGERGVLRVATKCITYGVMFMIMYWILLGRWFGLAGAFAYGPLMAIQHGGELRSPRDFVRMFLFAALRSFSLGAAGWLAVDPRFGIAFALLGTIALTISYATTGFAGIDVSEWVAPRVDAEALIKGFARGLAFGAAAILSALLLKEPQDIWFGAWVGIVTGISTSLFIIFSPSVGWWADHLPARRLGAYGAMLVVIGSAIQALQYLLPLIGVTIT